MQNILNLYVLTSLRIDSTGNVVGRNLGVTFNIHEAEAHREKGVENEFETFQIDTNGREVAEQTELVLAMRTFREIVEEMQRKALGDE